MPERVVEVRVPPLPVQPPGVLIVPNDEPEKVPVRPPDLLSVTPLPVERKDAQELSVLLIDRQEKVSGRKSSPTIPLDKAKSKTNQSPLPLPLQLPAALPSPPDIRPPLVRPVKQQIEELLVMTANDEIEAKILNLIIDIRTQLQWQVDQNTTRLNALEAVIPGFVDKDYVAKFFQKMRAAVNEISSHVTTMRQAFPERVTKTELRDSMEEIMRSFTQERETSGGGRHHINVYCVAGKRKGYRQ
jgi:hypothetical protein